MRIRSLKVRLLIVQTIIIVLTLSVTGLGLTLLFERHVERRIGAELNTYLDQIAARVTLNDERYPKLSGKLADPRFDNIYSGLYWQITNENSDHTSRSRSLWDTKLILQNDYPALGKIHTHTIAGPQNSLLLVHERRLSYDVDSEKIILRLALAIDLAGLKHSSHEFSEEVFVALIILGGLLLIASWIQVTLGLHPLSLIQNSISAIRQGTRSSIPTDFPAEVSPLVEEVNSLLSYQEHAIQSAKNKAGDLAHGFKTPLTALKTDIRKLKDKGEVEIASDIEQTSQIMQRQIERELAKTRVRNTSPLPSIDASSLIEGIVKTVNRTPNGESKTIQVKCKEGFLVPILMDDLADIIGNLLENAAKHAKENIRITVQTTNEGARFMIEDDGPGITKIERESALKRGVKLDQAASGTGLGLAIVSDLLDAYGGTLVLNKSTDLGGLNAEFVLPISKT